MIEVNKNKRGGRPVVKGTRFPVSQVLEELRDDLKLSDIAKDYGLDLEALKSILRYLSIRMDDGYF
jgi:uncharacterized protein (DUF433 family)